MNSRIGFLPVSVMVLSLWFSAGPAEGMMSCHEPQIFRSSMPLDAIQWEFSANTSEPELPNSLEIFGFFQPVIANEPFVRLFVFAGGENGYSFELRTTASNDVAVNGYDEGRRAFSIVVDREHVGSVIFQFVYTVPEPCPEHISIYTATIPAIEQSD